MTNKQIDELNELLVDHGEVITAFVDEVLENYKKGYSQGFQKQVERSAIFVGGCYVIAGICYVIVKKIKKSKDKSR